MNQQSSTGSNNKRDVNELESINEKIDSVNFERENLKLFLKAKPKSSEEYSSWNEIGKNKIGILQPKVQKQESDLQMLRKQNKEIEEILRINEKELVHLREETTIFINENSKLKEDIKMKNETTIDLVEYFDEQRHNIKHFTEIRNELSKAIPIIEREILEGTIEHNNKLKLMKEYDLKNEHIQIMQSKYNKLNDALQNGEALPFSAEFTVRSFSNDNSLFSSPISTRSHLISEIKIKSVDGEGNVEYNDKHSKLYQGLDADRYKMNQELDESFREIMEQVMEKAAAKTELENDIESNSREYIENNFNNLILEPAVYPNEKDEIDNTVNFSMNRDKKEYEENQEEKQREHIEASNDCDVLDQWDNSSNGINYEEINEIGTSEEEIQEFLTHIKDVARNIETKILVDFNVTSSQNLSDFTSTLNDMVEDSETNFIDPDATPTQNSLLLLPEINNDHINIFKNDGDLTPTIESVSFLYSESNTDTIKPSLEFESSLIDEINILESAGDINITNAYIDNDVEGNSCELFANDDSLNNNNNISDNSTGTTKNDLFSSNESSDGINLSDSDNSSIDDEIEDESISFRGKKKQLYNLECSSSEILTSFSLMTSESFNTNSLLNVNHDLEDKQYEVRDNKKDETYDNEQSKIQGNEQNGAQSVIQGEIQISKKDVIPVMNLVTTQANNTNGNEFIIQDNIQMFEQNTIQDVDLYDIQVNGKNENQAIIQDEIQIDQHNGAYIYEQDSIRATSLKYIRASVENETQAIKKNVNLINERGEIQKYEQDEPQVNEQVDIQEYEGDGIQAITQSDSQINAQNQIQDDKDDFCIDEQEVAQPGKQDNIQTISPGNAQAYDQMYIDVQNEAQGLQNKTQTIYQGIIQEYEKDEAHTNIQSEIGNNSQNRIQTSRETDISNIDIDITHAKKQNETESDMKYNAHVESQVIIENSTHVNKANDIQTVGIYKIQGDRARDTQGYVHDGTRAIDVDELQTTSQDEVQSSRESSVQIYAHDKAQAIIQNDTQDGVQNEDQDGKQNKFQANEQIEIQMIKEGEIQDSEQNGIYNGSQNNIDIYGQNIVHVIAQSDLQLYNQNRSQNVTQNDEQGESQINDQDKSQICREGDIQINERHEIQAVSPNDTRVNEEGIIQDDQDATQGNGRSEIQDNTQNEVRTSEKDKSRIITQAEVIADEYNKIYSISQNGIQTNEEIEQNADQPVKLNKIQAIIQNKVQTINQDVVRINEQNQIYLNQLNDIQINKENRVQAISQNKIQTNGNDKVQADKQDSIQAIKQNEILKQSFSYSRIINFAVSPLTS
ncbi:hypothetical protein K502DRAFT_363148 [Neoconidiobolus thromboides FSU 785]|nr:hypothetical protein K502DRAFT_363148 [Neoconidiobolus thromboides FSU 785]